jgi:hypothetical protein
VSLLRLKDYGCVFISPILIFIAATQPCAGRD